VAIVSFTVFITQTKYFQEILVVIRHAPAEGGYLLVVIYDSWTHLLEYGEAAINVPLARMPGGLQAIVPFAG